MPCSGSAGRSTLKGYSPSLHLQQISHLLQASVSQNLVLLLQKERPGPKGKNYRMLHCVFQSGSSQQPTGQPGGGDAQADLERPEVAEGQAKLPKARATAPGCHERVKSWHLQLAVGDVSGPRPGRETLEPGGFERFTDLAPQSPICEIVPPGLWVPHPKPSCLVPPVTPFSPSVL